jgi:hypothetical protein
MPSRSYPRLHPWPAALAIALLLPAIPGCTRQAPPDIPFSYRVLDAGAIALRAVGDVDGDGRGDIVAAGGADADSSAYQGTLAWYAYPDFAKHVLGDAADLGYVADIELADVDGDGDLDLVLPDSRKEAYRRIFWYENARPAGDPAVGLWPRHLVAELGPGPAIKDLVVVDLDRDGRLDLVTRLNDGLAFWLQREEGAWAQRLIQGLHRNEGMDAGDLDSDGDPDLALNGYWLETPADPLQDEFREHVIDDKWFTQHEGGWRANNCRVCVADVDRDGRQDVLLTSSEYMDFPVSWYDSDPRHPDRWREHRIGQLDYGHSLLAADMDDDGDTDVIAAEMPRYDAPWPVLVYRNLDGAGRQWFPQTLSDTTGSYILAVGDLGGDGDLDLVGGRSFDRPPLEIWENHLLDDRLALARWTVLCADSTREKIVYSGDEKPRKAMGLALADLTGDGLCDIASGRYFYRNPGGCLSGPWPRTTFPEPLDALLALDVDGDARADLIGRTLHDLCWIEARDAAGTAWEVHHVGVLPEDPHGSSQGYRAAQIVPGGRQEIVLVSGRTLLYFTVPDDPSATPWPAVVVSETCVAEGIAVGDVNGDGRLDVAGSVRGEEGTDAVWWENPGDGVALWTAHRLGHTPRSGDRFELADLNADGRLDLVVSEETRTDGAGLYWFAQPDDPTQEDWPRTRLAEQWTTNSLDVADLDRDGDLDIVCAEHRGPQRVQIWENLGGGAAWRERVISRGVENHLGARTVDLDGDGDLDLVGIAWDAFPFLHIWRNDAVR